MTSPNNTITPPVGGHTPDASADDRVRPLHENLARYLDPCAFDGRRRSKRNSDAAFRARKHATKQARAAIRFMLKPGNLDRLLASAAARKESPDE